MEFFVTVPEDSPATFRQSSVVHKNNRSSENRLCRLYSNSMNSMVISSQYYTHYMSYSLSKERRNNGSTSSLWYKSENLNTIQNSRSSHSTCEIQLDHYTTLCTGQEGLFFSFESILYYSMHAYKIYKKTIWQTF